MRFNHDFGGNDQPKRWLPFLRDRMGKPDVIEIEIGCFEGMSTVFALENIITHPASRIICIDPFKPSPGFMNGQDLEDFGSLFLKNIAPYQERVIILPKFSNQVTNDLARILKPGSVDIALIDGCHDDPFPLADAEMCFPYIRSGGLIAFDDVQWDAPRLACETFTRMHGLSFVIREGTQWVVKK